VTPRRAAAALLLALLASCRACDEGRAVDAGPYIDDGYQPPMPKGMLVPAPPPIAEETTDASHDALR
jgi:hypothetical protein